MTRSASAAAPSSEKVRKRASTPSRSSSVSCPLTTERAVAAAREAVARREAASLVSMPMTSRPARARTSAMPEPIVPRPTTAMVCRAGRTGSAEGADGVD